MKPRWINQLIVIPLLLLLSGCSAVSTTLENVVTFATGETEIERPAGWLETSHSNDVDPNYQAVFPQDKVNQLTITISPENWEAMQANMVELLGEPGQGGFGGPPGGPLPEGFELPEGFVPGGPPPEGFELPEGFVPGGPPPEGFELPEGFVPGGPPPEGFAGPNGGPPADFTTENPMWVEATITFEGQSWTHVGVRYKGNSSLMSGWNSESLKMPLKLDFDQFEETYPEINNQRFYGFKQLSLANGFGDETFMRDAITYDLLEKAGLPAVETAFYEIILDYGEGPVSLGLYTVIEVVDDTAIKRLYGDDTGNIYEGDGSGVSLAEGSSDQIQSSFLKENNEEEADWSDIEALYEALHSTERTGNPAVWRQNLETIFDVNAFLKWLALSAVIQHWDTYGNMSHNFYLYHDPESGQLKWISWDHNLVMEASPGPGGMRPMPETTPEAGTDVVVNVPNPAGGPGNGPGGGMGNVTLDKANVTENWPLIRYLLDDPVYHDQYVAYVAEMGELFTSEEVITQYETWANLLEPYATADVGEENFNTAVTRLIEFTNGRSEAVAEFLESEKTP